MAKAAAVKKAKASASKTVLGEDKEITKSKDDAGKNKPVVTSKSASGKHKPITKSESASNEDRPKTKSESASGQNKTKTASRSTSGKGKPIKYTDKSPGQPELAPIFYELKKLVEPYAKGHLLVRGDAPGQYHLWSDKPIEVAGRKRDDVYFAGLMVQKGFVGFYFMPGYANPGLVKELHPDLVKCLKGKSCYHIKKNDPALMKHVKDALKIGYADYKQKGWV